MKNEKLEISDSFELFKYLKDMGYLKELRDPLWWPNSGSFEVVVGAILTQQTRWEKVEKALENLKKHNLLDLKTLAECDTKLLSTLIKPSGFYNTKAKRLKLLSNNILRDFGDFDIFKERVEREWLLSQKGLGKESSDSILCYACLKDIMPVDNYTAKVLNSFGYDFEEYDELREWCESGVLENLDKIHQIYGEKKPVNEIFARFHGKIVEYAKEIRRK
jgi:endonuclease-3 related protein